MPPDGTIRRAPPLAALLFVVPLAFCPWTLDNFERVKLSLLLLGAIGVATAALSRVAPRRLLGRPDPVSFAVAAGLLAAAVSAAFSIDRRVSIFGDPASLHGLLTIAALAVLTAAARAAGRSEAARRRCLEAAFASGALAAIYALAQLLQLDPLRWGGTASFAGSLRPFGTLGHPMLLGGYLAMVLPLGACLLGEANREGKRLRATLLAVALVACAAALVASLSRAAWGAGAAGLLTAWLLGGWRARYPRRAALLAALGTVAAVALSAGLRSRLLGFFQAPSRLAIWRVAWALFLERPLSGIGLDAFRLGFIHRRTAAYWALEFGATPSRAHSQPLEILATEGLLGALAAALLAWALASALIRARRTASPPVVAALAGALVAFAVQGLTGFTVAATGLLFAACAGFLSSLAWPEPFLELRRTPPLVRPLVWGGGAAAALALAIAPTVADLFAQRGSHRAAADPAKAVAALSRARRLAPLEPRDAGELGLALARLARQTPAGAGREALTGEAEAALGRAIALEPLDPAYDVELGSVEAELSPSRWPEAQASFERALTLDPANALAYLDAGRAALRVGRPANALLYASRLLARYPDLPEALDLQVRARRSLGARSP